MLCTHQAQGLVGVETELGNGVWLSLEDCWLGKRLSGPGRPSRERVWEGILV